ncbi:hypothetical protein EV191_1011448 [Tamaricihabitans halophyticus]|uniref:Uncharacterized protein n=1 Tax=Tamaricihabitans halophyticus TaxID=1262583 RepID=A0A4R2RCN4_9PSEU|nr:hypothetical protein [Tamaricihabitans halophyticus]TCP57491.1 hypothetical protein EV191_1011448 [Tamaricihabitans halophyticus]
MASDETFRHALVAQLPFQAGGGACTVLVRRVGGDVQLLFHAVLDTTAVLTRQQVEELIAALSSAAE